VRAPSPSVLRLSGPPRSGALFHITEHDAEPRLRTYYFLQADFEELGRRISAVEDRIRRLGKDMGQSCQEGAETFHDNFAYEDGERNQRMWSQERRRLLRLQAGARLVEVPPSGDRAAIGRTVVVLDQDSGAQMIIRIGSYENFAPAPPGTISYSAPMAQILLGAEAGEEREGTIAGKMRRFEVLDVE
jgi:transcription elongation GreA/GreB family factor